MSFVKIATDGATGRSNPGRMTVGVLIFDDKESDSVLLDQVSGKRVGWGSNSVAEYEALIHGLELANKNGYKKVQCYVDSLLVRNQISGDYRVNDKKLIAMHRHTMSLLNTFHTSSICWHDRFSDLGRAADAASKGTVFTIGDTLCQITHQLPKPRTPKKSNNRPPLTPLSTSAMVGQQ